MFKYGAIEIVYPSAQSPRSLSLPPPRSGPKVITMESMEHNAQDAYPTPPGICVPPALNPDGFFGPASVVDWRDSIRQEPFGVFSPNAVARNDHWTLSNSSESVGMINMNEFHDEDLGNWLSLDSESLSQQPDANIPSMSLAQFEPAASNYALPAHLTYTSPESCDLSSSVVMANYPINSTSILHSSFTPAAIGATLNNGTHRSCEPYYDSHLQNYPAFAASNTSYRDTDRLSGNPTVPYHPRPLGVVLHQYEAPGPLIHPLRVAAPSERLKRLDLDPEPRMLRCEWEGTCRASIPFDQTSINRHVRTHIAEELAKALSGVVGTTMDGKAKVRYSFDPTRSWLPSGITFDDLEVGARVRMVIEKGKVWARCLWGSNGSCGYCRTVGEKDKGELTLEYLPRHIWGIHFGMGGRN